ncbi:MAG: prokaryotic ubiquitin-like protein Pup [Actinomycetota bacterium]|nr:prokaryotic ubiquitin-like protein Pup [Actinomycetota bacterium]
MPDQERVHKRSEAAEDDAATTAAPSTKSDAEARDAEVDALLDEIDDVLETNAEEFVAAFVQKGGQ